MIVPLRSIIASKVSKGKRAVGNMNRGEEYSRSNNHKNLKKWSETVNPVERFLNSPPAAVMSCVLECWRCVQNNYDG
jgi:hypothetical protein